jgi:hypothetical protein
MKSRRLFLFVSSATIALAARADEPFAVKYGPDKFAKIEYPAAGNVKMQEGTFESWVRLGYEPSRRTKLRWYSPMTFFRVGVPGGATSISLVASHGYSEGLDRHGASLRLSGDVTSASLDAPYDDLPNWHQGTWHHLAVTWKRVGAKMRLGIFVDGKLQASEEREPEGPIVLPEDAVIGVGAHYFNSCYATVDGVRLSVVERTPEEIARSAEQEMAWDRLTLLLDRFERVEQSGRRRAVTTTEKGDAGTVLGTYEIVHGKFGNAVKLHAVEE